MKIVSQLHVLPPHSQETIEQHLCNQDGCSHGACSPPSRERTIFRFLTDL